MEDSYPKRSGAPSILQSEVLWLEGGVFYMRVPLEGDAQGLTVALHGVSDQVQATEAYRALLQLTPQTPCVPCLADTLV